MEYNTRAGNDSVIDIAGTLHIPTNALQTFKRQGDDFIVVTDGKKLTIKNDFTIAAGIRSEISIMKNFTLSMRSIMEMKLQRHNRILARQKVK